MSGRHYAAGMEPQLFSDQDPIRLLYLTQEDIIFSKTKK